MPTVQDVLGPCPEYIARRRPCSCKEWSPVGPAHDMWFEEEVPRCSASYLFGRDAGFVERCQEIDALLQDFWIGTTLVERRYERCPGDFFYKQTQWQVLDTRGREWATKVVLTIEMWADESVGFSRNTPGLSEKVAELLTPEQYRQIGRRLMSRVRLRPVPFEIPRAHRKVHEVADRQGSWRCSYCGIGLIDVCRDSRDVEVDRYGLRLVSATTMKRLPTLDHIVPQALGGSNSLRNLALACQPCNSSKGAR